MSNLYFGRPHQREIRMMSKWLAGAAGALLLLLTGAVGSAGAAPFPGSCPQSVERCTYAPSEPSTPQTRSVAPQATPAAASPTLTVESRRLGYFIHAPGADHFVATGLKLHIVGSNFTPDSKVTIAVVDTSTWKMLFRGYAFAQDAVVSVMCPWGYYGCYRENPHAGTLDLRVRLDGSPGSSLEVLYRSTGHAGMSQVIVK